MASAAASRLRGVFSGTRALMAAAKPSPVSSSSVSAKKSSAKKPATTTTANRPKNGIQKVVRISPQLSNFLGVPESSRTDAVKKVWEYVKLHNLQNPANKREIFCDEKLKSIFVGKETVGILEVTRLLSGHFVKSG